MKFIVLNEATGITLQCAKIVVDINWKNVNLINVQKRQLPPAFEIVSNRVLAFFSSLFLFKYCFFSTTSVADTSFFVLRTELNTEATSCYWKVYTRLLFVVVYYSKRESMAAFFAKGGTRKEGRKKAPCEVCEHVCSHPTLISLLLASKTHNASKNYSDFKKRSLFPFHNG